MKIITTILIALGLFFTNEVQAQTVFSQQQVIIAPYNGIIVSSSTNGLNKLQASTSPSATNLYLSNLIKALSALFTNATTTNLAITGLSNTVLAVNSLGQVIATTTSGSGSTPGGSDTQVQFNDGGTFGGDAGFVYNKTLDRATLTELITTRATSTSATTTNFAVTGTATTTFGGGISATELNLTGLTADRILGSDGNKRVIALDTATYPSLSELSYVKGVTSSIQTQISGLVPYTGATGDVNLGTQSLTGFNLEATQGVTTPDLVVTNIKDYTTNFTTITGRNLVGTDGSTVIADWSTDVFRLHSAYSFPNADGTTGQVLTTDGAGVVTWEDAGSGSGTVTSGLQGQVPYYPANGDTIAGTSSIYIQEEKVAIGTTTPSAKIHLVTTGNTQAIATSTLIERMVTNTSSAIASLFIKQTTTGTANDGFGSYIGFINQDSTATHEIGRLRFTRSGNINAGQFDLYTGNNGVFTSALSASPTGIVTITNLLGTKATTTSATTTNFAIRGLSSTVLAVDQNGSVIATTTAGGGSGTVSSGTTGQIPWYASNGTTVVGTSTIFLTNQSVGIGTSTPNASLTVDGDTYVADNLTVAGTATSSFAGGVTSPCFATPTSGCIDTNSYRIGYYPMMTGVSYPNLKFYNLPSGTTTLYTVPAGKKLYLSPTVSTYNSTGSSIGYNMIANISGVDVVTHIGASVNANAGARTYVNIPVLEAGDSLKIGTNNTGLTIRYGAILFDDTVPIWSIASTTLSAGTTTIYTVPSGKTVMGLFDGIIGIENDDSPATSNSIKIVNLSSTTGITLFLTQGATSSPSTASMRANANTNSNSGTSLSMIYGGQATPMQEGERIELVSSHSVASGFYWYTTLYELK